MHSFTKLLLSLDTTKANGPDGISTLVLKATADQVLKHVETAS